MGIQDRDYMRERARKTQSVREQRERNPFSPSRAGPSTLVIALTWIAVAVVLYLGFLWLESRRSGQRLAGGNVAGMSIRPNKAPAAQVADEPQFVASVTPSARISSERDLPSVRARLPQGEPPEIPPARTGGTIYRCRAYNGGTFWAQAHCGQHQALIESIVPVPAGMSFEQQVELAEQRRPPTTTTIHNTHIEVNRTADASTKSECKALDARVEQLDAMARQPQSGQMQDWIRGQRQQARDRQFALRC